MSELLAKIFTMLMFAATAAFGGYRIGQAVGAAEETAKVKRALDDATEQAAWWKSAADGAMTAAEESKVRAEACEREYAELMKP